jgi:Secretin and TonB N terminus short domain
MSRQATSWILLLLSFAGVYAAGLPADETPLLERTVTISIREERMDAALKRIALQGGFTFSYNSQIINAERMVTVSFTNKTIREVLDQLFDGTILYKERGRYVILTKAPPAPKERVVGGYIRDENTGERLKNVTVYDPVSLSSAVTDSYGYFEIELKDPMANVTLVVNKQNYADTLLTVPPDELRLLKIGIKNNTDKIMVIADSVGQKIKRFWKSKVLTSSQDVNMLNVTDTLYRTIQVSVVPFIGTNHKLSGNVINDYSFNIYGGYSLGTKKLEIGNLFNIDRGYVKGAQFAGLFNVVGGDVRAFQTAGLINMVVGETSGAQFAGFVNLDWGKTHGFTTAGLMNFTRHGSYGVKFAGLLNTSLCEQRGWHSAGLANVAVRKTTGLQTAGLTNFSGDSVSGVQISGVANAAVGPVKGVQIGGLINVAVRDMQGLQLSGLVNYARRLKGAQVGFINVASDSVKGVQFGFLSFAWKGYHTLEVSSDEVFYANVAFRTGTRKFYNILTAGVQPATLDTLQSVWTFGYGVGTMPRLYRWLSLNIDLTANQVVRGNIEAADIISKLYVGFDVKLTNKLAVTAGVTLNARATEMDYDNYPDLFTDYKPSIFASQSTNSSYWQWWWGGKVGIRFL